MKRGFTFYLLMFGGIVRFQAIRLWSELGDLRWDPRTHGRAGAPHHEGCVSNPPARIAPQRTTRFRIAKSCGERLGL